MFFLATTLVERENILVGRSTTLAERESIAVRLAARPDGRPNTMFRFATTIVGDQNTVFLTLTRPPGGAAHTDGTNGRHEVVPSSGTLLAGNGGRAGVHGAAEPASGGVCRLRARPTAPDTKPPFLWRFPP